MDIGLLTDSVEDLTFDQTLDLANEVGISCVEFAAGNWSTSPHIDVPALLENRRARTDFLAAVEYRGLRISALNASGNQLHPRDGQRNDKMVRDVILGRRVRRHDDRADVGPPGRDPDRSDAELDHDVVATGDNRDAQLPVE